MRLIDADALIERIKYSNHEYERVRIDTVTGCLLTDSVSPTIDPVHAAGAVYCKECKYHDDEVYPDSEWELHDHQECWCNWWDSVMPLNGFCSEGRKDDTKNA